MAAHVDDARDDRLRKLLVHPPLRRVLGVHSVELVPARRRARGRRGGSGAASASEHARRVRDARAERVERSGSSSPLHVPLVLLDHHLVHLGRALHRRRRLGAVRLQLHGQERAEADLLPAADGAREGRGLGGGAFDVRGGEERMRKP